MQVLQTNPHHRLEVTLHALVINGQIQRGSPSSNNIELGAVPVGLDFSRTDLELPLDICTQLADQLGMTWDDDLRHYVVSDKRHQELITANASITFMLGGSPGPQQPIVVPYESLVVQGTAPAVKQPLRYIAIRQTNGKFNLGRVFFQDAYITAHFDRPSGPFIYLRQAKYDPSISPQITEIDSHHGQFLNGRHSKIGIILPVVLVCLALLSCAIYLLWARRVGWVPFRRRKTMAEKRSAELENASNWSGARKVEPQEPAIPSNTNSVYYEARSEQNEEGPGEGSSHPPPRYSTVIDDAANREPKDTKTAT
jgi:hypothetical protein